MELLDYIKVMGSLVCRSFCMFLLFFGREVLLGEPEDRSPLAGIFLVFFQDRKGGFY